MKKLIALLTVFVLLLSLPLAMPTLAEENSFLSQENDEDPEREPEDDPEEDPEDDPEELPEDRPDEEVEQITPATLEIIAPDKRIYIEGEAPDYTGGSLIYTDATPLTLPLDGYCNWPDFSTPGNKRVTVTINGLTAYFNITVLSKDEPITTITDIKQTHWSYIYFGPCMKAGYFAGDDLKHLNPDTPITRAEMAQIIYRAWQNDPDVMEKNAANPAPPFVDVPEWEWYYEAIEACRKAGIIRGMEDSLCKPDEAITREDAVLMLMRIRHTEEELATVNITKEVLGSGLNPSDFGLVSNYAKGAMALALGDLIFGNEDQTILPQNPITRAEAATVFHRLFLKDYEWEIPSIPEKPAPEETPEEEPMPLIYLSPSNQFYNSYATGKTNEGDQMYRIGEAVERILLQKGYRVYLAERNRSIVDRPNDAAAMGADLYIPIHSNAGGKQVGTYVFYNGSIEGCAQFSREIFNRLAALTGTPYSTSRHKEDYLSLLPNGAPFKEVMYPTMPVAFIEVEFHDKPAKAQWIIHNTEAIARAIAEGVIAYSEKYLIK